MSHFQYFHWKACKVDFDWSCQHYTSLSSYSLFFCSTKEIFNFLFNCLFFIHSHFLPSLWHSVTPTNCFCSAFFFRSLNRFSFFSFLFTLNMYFSKLSSAATVMTKASLLCVVYFAILHSPLQHNSRRLSDLFLYYFLVCRVCLHMTVDGVPIYGYEYPSLLIHFLKFFLCPLLLFKFYTGTVQILIAWNTFLVFSFDLRADLTCLKYSVLTLLLICFWKKSLLSMMSSY